MPLEIIGAGWGRTGTDSLKTALNILGFPCYHAKEMIKYPDHIVSWWKMAHLKDRASFDFESAFYSNYQATLDAPSCQFYRELHERFPDAKVILSLHPRGPEGWYSSTLETIWPLSGKPSFGVWLISLFIPPVRTFHQLQRETYWGPKGSLQGTFPDKEKAIARYNQHIEEVKELIPPHLLLIHRATDGWEPLCKFLGVEVPSDPYPRVNERAEILRTTSLLNFCGYLMVAMTASFVAFLGYKLF